MQHHPGNIANIDKMLPARMRYDLYCQFDSGLNDSVKKYMSEHGKMFGGMQDIWSRRMKNDFGVGPLEGNQQVLYKTIAEMSELKSFLKQIAIYKFHQDDDASRELKTLMLRFEVAKKIWRPLTDAELIALAKKMGHTEKQYAEITHEIDEFIDLNKPFNTPDQFRKDSEAVDMGEMMRLVLQTGVVTTSQFEEIFCSDPDMPEEARLPLTIMHRIGTLLLNVPSFMLAKGYHATLRGFFQRIPGLLDTPFLDDNKTTYGDELYRVALADLAPSIPARMPTLPTPPAAPSPEIVDFLIYNNKQCVKARDEVIGKTPDYDILYNPLFMTLEAIYLGSLEEFIPSIISLETAKDYLLSLEKISLMLMDKGEDLNAPVFLIPKENGLMQASSRAMLEKWKIEFDAENASELAKFRMEVLARVAAHQPELKAEERATLRR